MVAKGLPLHWNIQQRLMRSSQKLLREPDDREKAGENDGRGGEDGFYHPSSSSGPCPLHSAKDSAHSSAALMISARCTIWACCSGPNPSGVTVTIRQSSAVQISASPSYTSSRIGVLATPSSSYPSPRSPVQREGRCGSQGTTSPLEHPAKALKRTQCRRHQPDDYDAHQHLDGVEGAAHFFSSGVYFTMRY